MLCKSLTLQFPAVLTGTDRQPMITLKHMFISSKLKIRFQKCSETWMSCMLVVPAHLQFSVTIFSKYELWFNHMANTVRWQRLPSAPLCNYRLCQCFPALFREGGKWDVFLSFSGFCLALRSTDQPGLSLYICLEVNGLGYFTQNETLVLCFYSPGH